MMSEGMLGMSDWQPIETAPKDGSEIILGREPADDLPGWSCAGYWSDRDQGWLLANIDWTDYHANTVHPTHWQPLPEPPEVSDT